MDRDRIAGCEASAVRAAGIAAAAVYIPVAGAAAHRAAVADTVLAVRQQIRLLTLSRMSWGTKPGQSNFWPEVLKVYSSIMVI